jgi:hypothetical protein
MAQRKQIKNQSLELKDRIDHLLEEIRIILPGTQALLGFQFVAVFSQNFNSLPIEMKYLHLASLCLVTLTTILLMSPAAFDRIVRERKNNPLFIKYSSQVMLVAMISLALGLAGDIFVVARYITRMVNISFLIAMATLLLTGFFWFGFSFYKLSQKR